MRRLVPVALTLLLIFAAEPEPHILFAQKKKIKAAPPTAFTAVVRAHFDNWDKDGDGKLTSAEIAEAMTLPRWKGEVAAALATLKYVDRYDFAREEKKMPPLTLDKLQRYEAAYAAKRKLPHEYDELFAEHKRKLAQTTRELFPEEPRLNAIKQGGVGDCWFMSMMGAFLKMYPDRVKHMVVRDGKGYSVQFAGRVAPVFIPPPSDAEICLYTSAEKNGLWLTVIEKAFAKAFSKELKKENRKEHKKKKGKMPFGEFIEGEGAASDAIAMLTGHATDTEERDSPRLQKVLAVLAAKKCLISTTVLEKDPGTPGVWTGHLYAVIGYNPKTKQVTIFDPLGEDFKPEGPPGPVNGWRIKAGVFTVSFREFVQVFDGIDYENPTRPAHEPKKKKKN